jgi:hypothetical protein
MIAASISCLPGRGVDRAPPGIEKGLVLEGRDGGADRIERAAAVGQNGPSRVEGAAQANMIGRLPLRIHLAAQDRARAAMDGESEVVARGRVAGHEVRAFGRRVSRISARLGR